jgi:hypothetical protein
VKLFSLISSGFGTSFGVSRLTGKKTTFNAVSFISARRTVLLFESFQRITSIAEIRAKVIQRKQTDRNYGSSSN